MLKNQILIQKTVPVNLSKLSNVVKNEIVKKTAYDQLLKQINTIQTIDTKKLS